MSSEYDEIMAKLDEMDAKLDQILGPTYEYEAPPPGEVPASSSQTQSWNMNRTNYNLRPGDINKDWSSPNCNLKITTPNKIIDFGLLTLSGYRVIIKKEGSALNLYRVRGSSEEKLDSLKEGDSLVFTFDDLLGHSVVLTSDIYPPKDARGWVMNRDNGGGWPNLQHYWG